MEGIVAWGDSERTLEDDSFISATGLVDARHAHFAGWVFGLDEHRTRHEVSLHRVIRRVAITGPNERQRARRNRQRDEDERGVRRLGREISAEPNEWHRSIANEKPFPA